MISVFALCTGSIELDRASMLSDLAAGQPWTVPVLSFLVDHPRAACCSTPACTARRASIRWVGSAPSGSSA